MTKARLKKLKYWNTPVVLMLDGDAAGREAAKKLAKTIVPVVPSVFMTQLPAGKDPAECSEEALAKSFKEKTFFLF